VRIARFAHSQGLGFGVVEGPAGAPAERLQLAEVAELPLTSLNYTGRRFPMADVRLLAPILPSKVVCVGKNYAAHVAEMGGGEAPTTPVIFLKPSSSVVGPGAPIRLPASSENVHFEGELAVVIGTLAKDVRREDALGAVFGYSIANDVTARDQQSSDGQWTRAKGYDSFCPLGPWIETELDTSDLSLRTEVGGERKQDGRTADLIHDVADLIEFMSGVMTLWPGDIILTGTPAGVGPIVDGDTVSITIEGIGTLTNPVQNK